MLTRPKRSSSKRSASHGMKSRSVNPDAWSKGQKPFVDVANGPRPFAIDAAGLIATNNTRRSAAMMSPTLAMDSSHLSISATHHP